MNTKPVQDHRLSHVITALAVIITFGLVALLVFLPTDVEIDVDGTPRRCAPATPHTVDPVTCLPYGTPGAPPAPSGNAPGSNAKKPAPVQPKAPAVKAPSMPKAPAAPRVRMGK